MGKKVKIKRIEIIEVLKEENIVVMKRIIRVKRWIRILKKERGILELEVEIERRMKLRNKKRELEWKNGIIEEIGWKEIGGKNKKKIGDLVVSLKILNKF